MIGADALAIAERFLTNHLRTINYDELEPIMFAATRKKTKAQWIEELGDTFVVGPLNNIAEVANDTQVNNRNMIVELPTWTGGSLKVSNTPVKHSRTLGGAITGASKPGEHTNEILETAGFSHEEINSLIDSGVVAISPNIDD